MLTMSRREYWWREREQGRGEDIGEDGGWRKPVLRVRQ
jgi:hypothetical protein